MKDLQFVKVSVEGDSFYEAEVEVINDFNLHLERESEGDISIGVKTSGDKYDFPKDLKYPMYGPDFDKDYDDIVFPKMICVRSWSAVVSGLLKEKED